MKNISNCAHMDLYGFIWSGKDTKKDLDLPGNPIFFDRIHDRYRARNVVIYSSDVPAEAKEASRRPWHPRDCAKPMGRKGPIRFFADARSVRSRSRYMVFSSYKSLNGLAEVFYGNGYEHIFDRSRWKHVHPKSLRKPRKPIGILGTRMTAQSQWGERAPYAFLPARGAFDPRHNYRMFSSYNGSNGFTEMFLPKGCEHIFSPVPIELCLSQVPAEAKVAYRHPWSPRNRPKPTGRKGPMHFFRPPTIVEVPIMDSEGAS